MNAREQQLDEQVDRDLDQLLHRLTNAAPPLQLEQRVLAHLEQRETNAGSATTPRGTWLPTLRWPWTLATATAIAALLLAGILLSPHRTQTPQQAVTTPHATPTEQIAANVVPAPPQSRSTVELPGPPRRAVHHASATASAGAQAPSRTLDPAVCHCDPVAVTEASAPSHPAPPLPLTRAERHMLLLLRDGETEELAALNPDLRDLEFQRSRDDFNRFFAPPQPSSNSKPHTPQGNDQP